MIILPDNVSDLPSTTPVSSFLTYRDCESVRLQGEEVVAMASEDISLAMPVYDWPELDQMGAIVSRMTAERPLIPLTSREAEAVAKDE